jgi:hypothetical protein
VGLYKFNSVGPDLQNRPVTAKVKNWGFRICVKIQRVPLHLGKAAAEHMGCQFFAMKELHKEAELILCPYNYIFDVNIRNALEIDLSNAAVVIDEGHNIEVGAVQVEVERISPTA